MADALSCVELGTHPVCMVAELDLSMAQTQVDAEVQAYRIAITGLVLADVPLPGTDTTLHLDQCCQAHCSPLMAVGRLRCHP